MCMSSVTFTMKKNGSGEFVGTGYKRCGIDHRTKKLYKPFKKGKWVEDTRKSIITGPYDKNSIRQDYAPGFHLFASYEEALKYWGKDANDIFEVKFNDVVSTGTEATATGEVTCIIARKVKVVKLVQKDK